MNLKSKAGLVLGLTHFFLSAAIVSAQSVRIIIGPLEDNYPGTIRTYNYSKIDVDVWFKTVDTGLQLLHLPLSSNDEYVSLRLGGIPYHPLNTWDAFSFLGPEDDPFNEGFTSESLIGICDLTDGCSNPLDTEGSWRKVARFKMRSSSFAQYGEQLCDAFALGYHPRLHELQLGDYSCAKIDSSSILARFACLEFRENPCADNMLGDFNGDGWFNLADLTDCFSRLLYGFPEAACLLECPIGTGNEWAVAMDLNNSCSFNLTDVVVAFAKYRGSPIELLPCEYCPPRP